jgi:hypothetical protein
MVPPSAVRGRTAVRRIEVAQPIRIRRRYVARLRTACFPVANGVARAGARARTRGLAPAADPRVGPGRGPAGCPGYGRGRRETTREIARALADSPISANSAAAWTAVASTSTPPGAGFWGCGGSASVRAGSAGRAGRLSLRRWGRECGSEPRTSVGFCCGIERPIIAAAAYMAAGGQLRTTLGC